ncbi:MAG: hypothetical protein ACTHKG_18610 [Nocardioides sp.]
MGREQRWAASGVVLLLGAIWGGIALVGVTEPWRDTGPPDDSMGMAWVWLISCAALAGALGWLVMGLVTVRQVAVGAWRWRLPAAVGVLLAVLSLLYGFASLESGPLWWVLVLGFQAMALLAWSALLWTPRPPSAGTVRTTGPSAGGTGDGGRSA